MAVRHYNMYETEKGKHYVQTRLQTNTSGTKLPVAHDIDKGAYPNLKTCKSSNKKVNNKM